MRSLQKLENQPSRKQIGDFGTQTANQSISNDDGPSNLTPVIRVEFVMLRITCKNDPAAGKQKNSRVWSTGDNKSNATAGQKGAEVGAHSPFM